MQFFSYLKVKKTANSEYILYDAIVLDDTKSSV